MNPERIAITPAVSAWLKPQADFSESQWFFVVRYLVPTAILCGLAGFVLMRYMFDPTCLKGRLVGPPRVSLEHYHTVLSGLGLTALAVLAVSARSGARAWHDIMDNAARARAELAAGYMEVFSADLSERHLICEEDDEDLFVLIAPVGSGNTALIVLRDASEDELAEMLKASVRLSVLPLSRSIASIEFSGEPVSPVVTSAATGTALERYFYDQDIKWGLDGTIINLPFETTCALIRERPLAGAEQAKANMRALAST